MLLLLPASAAFPPSWLWATAAQMQQDKMSAQLRICMLQAGDGVWGSRLWADWVALVWYLWSRLTKKAFRSEKKKLRKRVFSPGKGAIRPPPPDPHGCLGTANEILHTYETNLKEHAGMQCKKKKINQTKKKTYSKSSNKELFKVVCCKMYGNFLNSESNLKTHPIRPSVMVPYMCILNSSVVSLCRKHARTKLALQAQAENRGTEGEATDWAWIGLYLCLWMWCVSVYRGSRRSFMYSMPFWEGGGGERSGI